MPDNSKIDKQIAGSVSWQIYLNSFGNYVLFCNYGYLQNWIDQGFLENSFFNDIQIGCEKYLYFISKSGYLISSVQFGPFPDDSIDARGFSRTFKKARQKHPDVSMQDAIYIEQYSAILPMYTSQESDDDKIIIGRWLSGGVNISTDSFSRLNALTNWMSSSELESIIEDSGIIIPEKAIQKLELDETNQNSKALSVPDAKFSLAGRKSLEQFFNEYIVDIIRNEDKYKKMGLGFPTAIVLHGKPGSGKTYAVEKFINFLKFPAYYIDSSTIASPYIHETSKRISQVFSEAISNAPSFVVIDEMEAFLTERDQRLGQHHIEEVAEFLRAINEANSNRVIVIGMTNMIDLIDPAIMRRGRFDHIIEVEMPTKDEVFEVLKESFATLPLNEDVDLSDLAEYLARKPLSDCGFLIREAGRLAVILNKETIDNECIKTAKETLQINSASKDNKTIGFK